MAGKQSPSQRPESEPSDGTWELKPQGDPKPSLGDIQLWVPEVSTLHCSHPAGEGVPHHGWTHAPSPLPSHSTGRPWAHSPLLLRPQQGQWPSETLRDTILQWFLRLRLFALQGHPILCRVPGWGCRPEPSPGAWGQLPPLPPLGPCFPRCPPALPPTTPAQGWSRHRGARS